MIIILFFNSVFYIDVNFLFILIKINRKKYFWTPHQCYKGTLQPYDQFFYFDRKIIFLYRQLIKEGNYSYNI